MTFTDFIAAIEHGASSIYHQVLATGAAISAWESDPIVAPLLSIGAAAANSALARSGVSAGTVTLIESDIATGLKRIAAADPTVPSLGGVSKLIGLAGSIAEIVDPAIAPAAAGIEDLGAVVEHIIESGASVTATSKTTTLSPLKN